MTTSNVEPTIVASQISAPPEWALLQRHLIEVNEQNAALVLEKHAAPGGMLYYADDIDDYYEVVCNWGLLYAMGARKQVFEEAMSVWNASTRTNSIPRLLGLPVNVNAEVVTACAEKEGVLGIMSEKPVATSLAEADRAIQACASRGIPWTSGDMFRNAPQLWKARALVEGGEIGEVQSIDVFGAGGNQMSGQGCRQLTEAFMFAVDADIDWVVGAVDGNPADAELGTIDEHSDHDQGIVFGFVQFANGATAHLHQNIAAKNGIEVHGSAGVLYIGQSRIGKIWHRDGSDLKLAGSLFEYPDAAQTALLTDYDEDGWEVQRTRMTDSVNAFVESVHTGAAVKCSGAELAKAMELAIAVRESHRRGIVKVKLPLADRELKIIPSARRYVGRRQSEGTESFLESIENHKQ